MLTSRNCSFFVSLLGTFVDRLYSFFCWFFVCLHIFTEMGLHSQSMISNTFGLKGFFFLLWQTLSYHNTIMFLFNHPFLLVHISPLGKFSRISFFIISIAGNFLLFAAQHKTVKDVLAFPVAIIWMVYGFYFFKSWFYGYPVYFNSVFLGWDIVWYLWVKLSFLCV